MAFFGGVVGGVGGTRGSSDVIVFEMKTAYGAFDRPIKSSHSLHWILKDTDMVDNITRAHRRQHETPKYMSSLDSINVLTCGEVYISNYLSTI